MDVDLLPCGFTRIAKPKTYISNISGRKVTSEAIHSIFTTGILQTYSSWKIVIFVLRDHVWHLACMKTTEWSEEDNNNTNGFEESRENRGCAENHCRFAKDKARKIDEKPGLYLSNVPISFWLRISVVKALSLENWSPLNVGQGYSKW